MKGTTSCCALFTSSVTLRGDCTSFLMLSNTSVTCFTTVDGTTSISKWIVMSVYVGENEGHNMSSTSSREASGSNLLEPLDAALVLHLSNSKKRCKAQACIESSILRSH